MKGEEGVECAMTEIDGRWGNKKIPGGRGWFLKLMSECVFQVDPVENIYNNDLVFTVFSHQM